MEKDDFELKKHMKLNDAIYIFQREPGKEEEEEEDDSEDEDEDEDEESASDSEKYYNES